MKLQTAVSIAVLCGFVLACASGQSTCLNFPSNFIPFSSIYYVTAANSVGDHVVVGVPAPGAMSLISANIPLPSATNQTFCDAQVQLAPGQLYPNVYVPTAEERAGIFSAFSGLLVNPANNLPYSAGVIPATQLNSVFAWRIGPAQATPASRGWSPTGSMAAARFAPAAVLLPSGKVLVVSGGDGEIYDPATGVFQPAGQLSAFHGSELTATLLNDGRVLIVGGGSKPSAAELYDPSTGKFTALPQTILPHGYGSTATLLNDGRVLIVGGLAIPGGGNSGGVGDSSSGAEIFDPKTQTFAKTGPMFADRNAHTATLLPDGRVLIAGGQFLGDAAGGQAVFDSAEIFDPSTGKFSSTSPMLATRTQHYAALLSSGKVLVGGGYSDTDRLSADLFDPVTLSFTSTGRMSAASRADSKATLLPSGQVLVAGGQITQTGITTSTNSTELYNPAAGAFTPAAPMGIARSSFAATLLLDGRVLVSGGNANRTGVTISSSEIYTPTVQGLITSQSGLTFRVAQGNGGLPVQQVAVLSNTDTIPWAVSNHTYQGGNWLIVSPAAGNSVPGAAPTTLTIAANSAGLPVQDYYGTVTLTPADGKHPPVSISIVLDIVPAGTVVPPVVSPAGFLFLGVPGVPLPPQTFSISNLTSSTVTFAGVGSTTPKWFSFAPAGGTIDPGQSASVTVTPTLTGLTAGVYNGSIALTFGDGSSQTIDLLLVLSATAGTANAPVSMTPKATTACSPGKLLPVFTTIGTGFNAPAAWPKPVVLEVVDDCGNTSSTGSVIVSFTDGDPPINLLSTGKGIWAGTWVPQNYVAGVTVRADAQASPLTGSVQVTGQVTSNPSVPVVTPGGVVSSGDYAGAPALGLLVSIFGSGLADGGVSAPVPLPPQLGTTQVVLGGEVLPLLYVSDSVINALIPYDLPVNTSTQLVVQRANSISVPVTTAIFNASPSVLSTAATGSGQGHVYVIGAGGIETLADQNHPAKAGDNVVIYCIGLGAVSPGIVGGQLALSDPLSKATVPVAVTFGTQTVIAGFAGLTPDETGLYQINTSIPAGVTPGNQVPVTIAAGGASSSAQIFIAVK